MSEWNLWLRAVCVAAAMGLAGAAAAQVPDPYARELARGLTQAEQTLAEAGYARAVGPFGGETSVRAGDQIQLTLRANQDYRILAVCSERCALSLRLLDPNGAPVARSLSDAGAAVTHVRPTLTGAYQVEIAAQRCEAPSCWYALNVYTR